jgi:hypothetical protein
MNDQNPTFQYSIVPSFQFLSSAALLMVWAEAGHGKLLTPRTEDG